MRVLVCGSRDYDDYARVFMELDIVHSRTPITLVIEGEARGADLLARRWAETMKIKVLAYPADWDKHGKRAGYIRNKLMLDEGKPDLVIAFWDGQSCGTEMMIDLARRAGVTVKVFRIISDTLK